MKNFTFILSALFFIVASFLCGYVTGYENNQSAVEMRALQLPDPGYETDVYSWGEIEYVVFGETQK